MPRLRMGGHPVEGRADRDRRNREGHDAGRNQPAGRQASGARRACHAETALRVAAAAGAAAVGRNGRDRLTR